MYFPKKLIDVKDIFYFIDIPFSLKIDILKGEKINFYGKGGVSFNMLLKNTGLLHTYYVDDTEGYDRNIIKFKELQVFNFRRFNISTIFSIGTNISITQNIYIQGRSYS